MSCHLCVFSPSLPVSGFVPLPLIFVGVCCSLLLPLYKLPLPPLGSSLYPCYSLLACMHLTASLPLPLVLCLPLALLPLFSCDRVLSVSACLYLLMLPLPHSWLFFSWFGGSLLYISRSLSVCPSKSVSVAPSPRCECLISGPCSVSPPSFSLSSWCVSLSQYPALPLSPTASPVLVLVLSSQLTLIWSVWWSPCLSPGDFC